VVGGGVRTVQYGGAGLLVVQMAGVALICRWWCRWWAAAAAAGWTQAEVMEGGSSSLVRGKTFGVK
jgi:hypothetical protein